MNSSVYRIEGCKGSQWLREIDFGLTAYEARRRARRANQYTADGLGLSLRDYSERSSGDEGWHISGRTGKDGDKWP